MTTHFAAYLDDQDLIRMEGGESVTAFLPFTLTSGSKTIDLLPTEEEKTLRSPLPIDMSQAILSPTLKEKPASSTTATLSANPSLISYMLMMERI